MLSSFLQCFTLASCTIKFIRYHASKLLSFWDSLKLHTHIYFSNGIKKSRNMFSVHNMRLWKSGNDKKGMTRVRREPEIFIFHYIIVSGLRSVDTISSVCVCMCVIHLYVCVCVRNNKRPIKSHMNPMKFCEFLSHASCLFLFCPLWESVPALS